MEADFQHHYRLDLADLYTGELSIWRAARLASQLPPGSAIFRGEDMDSRVLSDEARLLRLWINLNLEKKDQIPTVDQSMKKARKTERQESRAEFEARRAKRAVTDG